jgi:hypothetical protein
MPFSVGLVLLWVLGIPAFVVGKSTRARILMRAGEEPLRGNNAPRVAAVDIDADGPAHGVGSVADDNNKKLALTQVSCGYLFQRYRLRYVWWEAVRVMLHMGPHCRHSGTATPLKQANVLVPALWCPSLKSLQCHCVNRPMICYQSSSDTKLPQVTPTPESLTPPSSIHIVGCLWWPYILKSVECQSV